MFDFGKIKVKCKGVKVVFLGAVSMVFSISTMSHAQIVEKITEPDLVVSKNYGETRPLQTPCLEIAALANLVEADYAKMSLDDLRYQSAIILLFSIGSGDDLARVRLPDGIKAVRSDFFRRGKDAAAMLLKLLKDNPYSDFEARILLTIGSVPGMELEPFLNHAREAIEVRGVKLNPIVGGAVAQLLARHGNDDDIKLMKKWASERPYVEYIVETELRIAKTISQIEGSKAPTGQGEKSESGKSSGESNSTQHGNRSDPLKKSETMQKGWADAEKWPIYAGVIALLLVFIIRISLRKGRS